MLTCEDHPRLHPTHASLEGRENQLKCLCGLIAEQYKCKHNILQMVATAHKHSERLVVHICAVHSVNGKDITKVSVISLVTGMGPENGPYLPLIV